MVLLDSAVLRYLIVVTNLAVFGVSPGPRTRYADLGPQLRFRTLHGPSHAPRSGPRMARWDRGTWLRLETVIQNAFVSVNVSKLAQSLYGVYDTVALYTRSVCYQSLPYSDVFFRRTHRYCM